MVSFGQALQVYPLPLTEQRLLLQHVTGLSLGILIGFPEREVSSAVLDQFHRLCHRRLNGEPIAYLIGSREFYSLCFAVDHRALIPRPETEGLVDWALELGPACGPWRVLELGSGTGAIAITLKHQRPDWHISATDRSADALDLARHNAERLNAGPIDWYQGDWFEAIKTPAKFDLIVSNPPYVAPDSLYLQQGDLRFEPYQALVAMDHGMADLTHIITHTARFLTTSGHLLLEHGYDQGEACRRQLRQAGFHGETRHDLAGIERLSGGQRMTGD